jgi:glycosyltransferase involved in cell wall biosynthesis
MIKEEILVSVFVPVYNTKKYLREALDSILLQTHRNIEIIISDDYSTDGSIEILQEYAKIDSRIKLFLQKQNLGITRNCNFLLGHCKGDFICFFAGDDVLKRDCILRMLDYAVENQELAIIFHGAGRIDHNSNELPYPWKGLDTHYGGLEDFLRKGIYLGLNGMLANKKYIGKDNFDEKLGLASDFSIIWKILSKPNARFMFLAENLSYWRKHNQSVTMAKALDCTRDAMFENYELAFKYPAFARFALKRTKKQALYIAKGRKKFVSLILISIFFSNLLFLLEPWLKPFISLEIFVKIRGHLIKNL